MQLQRIVIFIMVLTLLMVGCSPAGAPASSATAPTPTPVSEMVFKTPEDAITYYFDGLKQTDVKKILQACAIDEMSEKFDFAQYTDWLKAFPPVNSQAPAEYPLYAEANKLQLSAQILNRVKMFMYGLLSDEKVDDGRMITQMDAARVNNFIKAVDPKRLDKLEVKKIVPPNKTLMSNAKYVENTTRQAHIYGADEFTERVALFSFDQKDYYLGFTLLRYGDNWKIDSQFSPLAGTNALGTPTQTTVEEFENLINK